MADKGDLLSLNLEGCRAEASAVTILPSRGYEFEIVNTEKPKSKIKREPK